MSLWVVTNKNQSPKMQHCYTTYMEIQFHIFYKLSSKKSKMSELYDNLWQKGSSYTASFTQLSE